MNDTCRWGILGAGRIAEKFASAVNFVEGAELYAVASRDGTKSKSFAEKFGAQIIVDNVTKEESEQTEKLVVEKYSSYQWNWKR